MSKLASNTCGDALQALTYIFHSEKFNERDLNNASAMLSQKGVSTDIQKLEQILKFMLNEWGIGFDEAFKTDVNGNQCWMFDSVTFLAKNPCIIGFMLKHSNDNWRVVKRLETTWELQKSLIEWTRIERHEVMGKLMEYNCPVFLLWKKWVPLQQWIKHSRPFYVRNADTKDNTRWEYEPTSCWMPQKMVYTGKNDKIKKILKKWNTPCLVSNAKQFLLLKPTNSGWDTEKIMEFDGVPKATVADRLAGLIEKRIEEEINKTPELGQKIMPHIAHALMCVASKFNIKINHKSLSAFDLDDIDIEKIRKYDIELEKLLDYE